VARLGDRPHHFPERSVDLLLNPPDRQRLDGCLGYARSGGSADPEFPMPGIAPDPEQGKLHAAMRHVRSPASDSLAGQGSRELEHKLFKNEQSGSQW
jgi:hypothetical protein